MSTSFPEVLAAAIAARQVTLGTLSRQLRALGTPVATASLSYWQTGHSVPSRPSSMRALGNLETLLQLAPDTLTGALRGAPAQAVVPEPAVDGLQQALADMGMSLDAGLAKLVLHDTLFVDEAPGRQRRVTRQVMRAVAEDVVRLPVITSNENPGTDLPEVEALDGCHVGGQARLDEFGVTVTELLLDRPLLQGFETQVGFQVTWPQGQGTPRCERQLLHPLHYLVLEARFLHEPPREMAYEYTASEGATPRRTGLRPGHDVQYVGLNLPAGVHALTWSAD